MGPVASLALPSGQFMQDQAGLLQRPTCAAPTHLLAGATFLPIVALLALSALGIIVAELAVDPGAGAVRFRLGMAPLSMLALRWAEHALCMLKTLITDADSSPVVEIHSGRIMPGACTGLL